MGMRPFYQLYESREQKAALEARNGLLLFEAIEKMVIDSKAGFTLTPHTLCTLHEYVIRDIYKCAGQFRTAPIIISGSKHQPPVWPLVAPMVDDMCKYINENFGKSPLHLAAYIMWRHNWIHPFMGGNGRTSRGLSYLVLNVRLGFNLPGQNTIAQQIEKNRKPYLDALEAADDSAREGEVDLSKMEELLSNMLAAQLLFVHCKASGK